MFGLPADVDLSFFVDAMLMQVCVGQNEVILNFEGAVRVTIESEIHLASPHVAPVVTESAVEAGQVLTRLLGKKITTAAGHVDGTTTLSFDEGSVLEIRDSEQRYESYLIKHGDKVIVV